MSPRTPTPRQIHHYDQVHAERTTELDALILTNRDLRRENRPEIVAACTAHYGLRELTHGTCAELLACAIERLAEFPKAVAACEQRETMPQ